MVVIKALVFVSLLLKNACQKKCAIRTTKFCSALIYMVGPQGLEPRTNGL